MKRLYLTLDDRLFDKISDIANKKGIPPTSLVVNNLEDLYLKNEAVDYESLLSTLCDEAKQMALNTPFVLAELPSFNDLIISTADKAHISPSPVRARVGKHFNMSVANNKVDGIFRATKPDGSFLNKAGVAMYVRVNKENEEEV